MISVKRSVRHDIKLVQVTFDGEVTDEDLLSGADNEVWSDPVLVRYPLLVDLRDVERISARVDSIRSFAWMSHEKEREKRPRLALVANRPATFGTTRMYQLIRQAQPDNTVDIAVFTDLAQAQRWLGVPVQGEDRPEPTDR
jgi:hypothetical protein